MTHKIDPTGTRIVKPKTHRLVFEDGKFKAISNRIVPYESRKFQRGSSAKLNIKAVKRFFERLTYADIYLAFMKRN